MLDYSPMGVAGYRVEIRTAEGLWLQVVHIDAVPSLRGSAQLLNNLALTAAMITYGENEFAARRSRSSEKRKSHRKAANRHAKEARAIASLVASLGDRRVDGWCSGCFERTEHRHARGHDRPRAKYLCQKCGTPTTRCAVPGCRRLAIVQPDAWHTLSYCAEHRHAIPSFEKLDARIASVDGWSEWAAFESRNAARATKVAGGTLAAAVVIAPAAFFRPPWSALPWAALPSVAA